LNFCVRNSFNLIDWLRIRMISLSFLFFVSCK